MADDDERERHIKLPTAMSGYKLKPSLDDAFQATNIKIIIRRTLNEKLYGKVYNIDDVRIWTRDIADSVNMRIKERIIMPRYKHVVQVMLAQQLGAGCHYYTKSCWDVDTDSQTSDTFINTSLFCVCTVFGVYLY